VSEEQGYPAGCAKCAGWERIMAEIHEAIGEAPESDDDSLPGVILQMVTEFRRRITWHEQEQERSKALEEALRGLFDEVTREYGAQPLVPAWVKAFETLEQSK
jgi:hypothetical protein